MLRIGIDLDNTIANYQKVFHLAAQEFSLCSDIAANKTKKRIKESAKNNPSDEFLWEKIQGKVYGKYMHKAQVFYGVYEFLNIAKNLGHKTYIISHKTEYGHFDDECISLRNEALSWLNQKEILPLVDGVYFESTRKEKIIKIKEMGCEIFIDDLSEVLLDHEFPLGVRKFQFLPEVPIISCDESGQITTFCSWRDLSIKVFGNYSEWPIKSISNTSLKSIKICKVSKVEGRQNSQIFKLTDIQSNQYALKIYPDLMKDPRQRLSNEFNAASLLADLGLPVPTPIFSCPKLNWGVYEWADGIESAVVNEDFIEQLIEFLLNMQKTKEAMKFDESFLASEAAISCEIICDQTYRKMERFQKIGNDNLNRLLVNKWIPEFEKYKAQARKNLGELYNKSLPMKEMVISPSDFGLHNALLQKNGKYIFYDFEYYGFDDPVKLTIDFMLHPAMNVSNDICSLWFRRISRVFNVDENFKLRLKSYLPILALRWAMIILNDFHRIGSISSRKESNYEDEAIELNLQLHRANRMIEAIPEKIKWMIDQNI